MEKFIIFIICFVLIISAFIYYEGENNEVEYIKSNIDNNLYLVRKMEDNQDAANILATIRQKLTKLSNTCLTKYPKNEAIKLLLYRLDLLLN